MVIRSNPIAGPLFVTIGLDSALVPRLRDIWINRELTEVTVFTRTGGGNRGEYVEANGFLRSHPGFLRDRDWERDATFAEWVFAVPGDKAAVRRADIAERNIEEQAKIYRIITADATSKWDVMMGKLARPEEDRE